MEKCFMQSALAAIVSRRANSLLSSAFKLVAILYILSYETLVAERQNRISRSTSQPSISVCEVALKFSALATAPKSNQYIIQKLYIMSCSPRTICSPNKRRFLR